MVQSMTDSTALVGRMSRLEEHMDKLQQSLKHWQTSEAEYEGLKEEVMECGQSLDKNDAERISNDFEAETVSTKDVNDLLFNKKGEVRSSNDIIGVLSRRIDYVQENIKSVEKQIVAAESDGATASMPTDGTKFEASGVNAVREIVEELDENDNVISTAIFDPEEQGSRLRQIVEKASRSGAELNGTRGSSSKTTLISNKENLKLSPQTGHDAKSVKPPADERTGEDRLAKNQASPNDSTKATSQISTPVKTPKSSKKTVSFAEGTKEEPERPTALRPNPRLRSGLPPKHQALIERLKRAVLHSGDETRGKPSQDDPQVVQERIEEVLEDSASSCQETASSNEVTDSKVPKSAEQKGLDESDLDLDMSSAKIPSNESPEDAALRSQMLKYNMDQVGSVVAEIDLEETNSEGSYSNGEDGDEYDTLSEKTSTPAEEEEDDDDEDDHGRSTKKMLSDQYVHEMEALQKQLRATSMKNVGPKISNANDLDVILAAEAAMNGDAKALVGETANARIMDHPEDETKAVEDRTVTSRNPLSPQSEKRKESRFKQARPTASPIPSASSPISSAQQKSEIAKPKKPHSDILERIPPPQTTLYSNTSSPPAPAPPDEWDPAFIGRQLNEEYHRSRNNLIYQQGGFLQTEEEKQEDEDMYERNDGSGRKVSRFMAARPKR